MSLVLNSTYASIGVQFVTGMIGVAALFVPLAPEHAVLHDLLLLETIVQFVELAVYIVIVARFHLETMAATRYFDWVITTPIMLLTTVVYMAYSTAQERKAAPIKLVPFLKDPRNKRPLIAILGCNMGMLTFGYLGEIGVIPRAAAWLVSSIFFVGAFGILYTEYARKSVIGMRLFAAMFGIWSLYAVAYLLSSVHKNVMINGLDIVAKNIFGIFLAVVIFRQQGKA